LTFFNQLIKYGPKAIERMRAVSNAPTVLNEMYLNTFKKLRSELSG
jgi:hypothetical protein